MRFKLVMWLMFPLLLISLEVTGQINLDSIRIAILEKERQFQKKPLLKKIGIAKELAFLYFYTDIDKKGFVNWSEQYFKLAEKLGDQESEKFGYFNFLHNYSFYDEERYISRLQSAKELAKNESNSALKLAITISESQYAAFIEGDFEASAAQLETAETMNDALGRNAMTPYLYYLFSSIYKYSGKPKKAVSYAKKIIDLENLSTIEKARGHNALGIALLDTYQLDSVDYHLKLASEYYQKMSNTYNLLNVYNKLGEYYLQQDEFQKALFYLLKIEPIIIQSEYNFGTPLYSVYFNIGELYASQSKQDSAKIFYEKSIRQAYAESDLDPLIKFRSSQSFESLSKLEEQRTNYKKALENFKLYKSYSDTLSKYTRNKTIEELSIKYETKEKTQQIALLNKDNQILKTRNLFFTIGALGAVMFSILIFYFLNSLRKEKKRSDELLLNILPQQVAEELKNKETTYAREHSEVTVIFTDFKDFSKHSAMLTPAELLEHLNIAFKQFDMIVEKYGIEKIKTIGDAYMAASGLHESVDKKQAALNAVHAALEMQEFINSKKSTYGKINFNYEMRIGIHTGNVVAGVVGKTKFQYDLWGNTVNHASRMESSGEAGEVNISEATYQMLNHQNGLHFIERQNQNVKGLGLQKMYFVNNSIMKK